MIKFQDRKSLLYPPKIFKEVLTGEEELLLELKIKVNVDLAGPSLLLVHWKDIALFTREAFRNFLNNNWLIVPVLMELNATVAQVDGPIKP